jgi:acetylornithine deacetylase
VSGGGDVARVLAAIDAERLERLTAEAVGCYSPSYAEGPIVDLFEEAILAAGLPCRRQPVPAEGVYGERANLVVELGPRPAELFFVGHVDTIPLLSDEKLGVRREGDVLHGLGAADMKAGCAAMVEAFAALARTGIEPKRGIALGLVVGEEEYGDGTAKLLEELRAPLVVIGEPTGLVPCFAHNGYFEAHLEAEGVRAHAALPAVGANAIHALLEWVRAIVAGLGGLAASGGLAVNLREINGGESRFVIAERCSALLDVHLPPGNERALIEAALEKARALVLAENGRVRFDWRLAYWAAGYALDAADPRLAALGPAFAACGLPCEPGVFRSHSDGSLFYGAGSAPVVCGPGRLEVAHTKHDQVSLKETLSAARLYAALAAGFAAH